MKIINLIIIKIINLRTDANRITFVSEIKSRKIILLEMEYPLSFH